MQRVWSVDLPRNVGTKVAIAGWLLRLRRLSQVSFAIVRDGRGLAQAADVHVVPVGRATPVLLQGADLVVAGGPTHAHGMSRASTRKAAADQANDGLILDPDAEGAGLREWFDSMGALDTASAAFDTRAPAGTWMAFFVPSAAETSWMPTLLRIVSARARFAL